MSIRAKRLNALLLAAVVAPGLASCTGSGGDVSYSGSVGMYYGSGFYDPWYYGPGYYPPAVIVPPGGGVGGPGGPGGPGSGVGGPRPEQPIAKPSTRPAPVSTRPSSSSMSRGGGGMRGGGRRR